jgi:hypothetical protein
LGDRELIAERLAGTGPGCDGDVTAVLDGVERLDLVAPEPSRAKAIEQRWVEVLRTVVDDARPCRPVVGVSPTTVCR